MNNLLLPASTEARVPATLDNLLVSFCYKLVVVGILKAEPIVEVTNNRVAIRMVPMSELDVHTGHALELVIEQGKATLNQYGYYLAKAEDHIREALPLVTSETLEEHGYRGFVNLVSQYAQTYLSFPDNGIDESALNTAITKFVVEASKLNLEGQNLPITVTPTGMFAQAAIIGQRTRHHLEQRMLRQESKQALLNSKVLAMAEQYTEFVLFFRSCIALIHGDIYAERWMPSIKNFPSDYTTLGFSAGKPSLQVGEPLYSEELYNNDGTTKKDIIAELNNVMIISGMIGRENTLGSSGGHIAFNQKWIEIDQTLCRTATSLKIASVIDAYIDKKVGFSGVRRDGLAFKLKPSNKEIFQFLQALVAFSQIGAPDKTRDITNLAEKCIVNLARQEEQRRLGKPSGLISKILGLR